MDEQRRRRRKRNLSIVFGSFLVTLCLLLTIFFPVFDGKTLLQYLSSHSPQVNPVSENDSAAYDYWYAPSNSFGINSTKTVNWTYWKGWLNDQFYWICQKSTNKVSWTDGSQFLHVNTVFNDTNHSAKVSIVLNTTGASTNYYYRFVLNCNETLRSYVNHSSLYEYDLTLPANTTENYTVAYNFSDLKPLLQQGVITVNSNASGGVFHCYVTTVTRIQPSRLFTIDPTFGITSGYKTVGESPIGNVIAGGWFTCNNSGVPYSITARLRASIGTYTGQRYFMIYDYTDYSSSYAGTLKARTVMDTTSLSTTSAWVTLLVNYTNGNLAARTKYYLVAWGAAGNGVLENSSAATFNIGVSDAKTYATVPQSPLTGETAKAMLCLTVYCTYYQNATLTTPKPTNGSTGVHVTPKVNITVTEPDGSAGTLYWWTNETGSWVKQQTNSSIGNGTYRYSYTGASANSHMYWWKIAFNNTYKNTTAWYVFTTEAGAGKAWYTIGTITGLALNTSKWMTRQTITGVLVNSTKWVTKQTILGAALNVSRWVTKQNLAGSFVNTSKWVTRQTVAGSITNTSRWVTKQILVGSFLNTSRWQTRQTITGVLVNSTKWRTKQQITGIVHNVSSIGWTTIQILSGTANNVTHWQTKGSFSGKIVNTSITPVYIPVGGGGSSDSLSVMFLLGVFCSMPFGVIVWKRRRKKP